MRLPGIFSMTSPLENNWPNGNKKSTLISYDNDYTGETRHKSIVRVAHNLINTEIDIVFFMRIV